MGEYLSKCGYTILGVRLAGHATQPEDMIRSRWWDWLACVEDGWHLLSGCTDQIFVLGLSMGGILSLTISSHMPVAGVVAMATPHHLPPDPRIPFIKPLSHFQRFIPKGPPQWHDLAAYQNHVDYPAYPTRAYAELRQLLERMRLGLGQVRCPALLIYSKADPTVTAAEGHMEKIFAALGSQTKQTLWVENSGHVITGDADRQIVYQACGEFIQRVSQEGL